MEDRKAAKVLEERIQEEFKVSQCTGYLGAATCSSSQATGADVGFGPVLGYWLVLSALWEQKSGISEQEGTCHTIWANPLLIIQMRKLGSQTGEKTCQSHVWLGTEPWLELRPSASQTKGTEPRPGKGWICGQARLGRSSHSTAPCCMTLGSLRDFFLWAFTFLFVISG